MKRGVPTRWKTPWIRSFVLGSAVVLLTLHVAACGAALALIPGGFPLDHLHTIAGLYLPAAVGLYLVVTLVRFVFFRASALGLSVGSAAIAGAWLGATATGALLFPISFGIERAIGPLTIASVFGWLAWAIRLRPFASAAAAWVGVGIGLAEILSLKSPAPSTHPTGGNLAEVHGDPIKEEAASGQVSFPCGKDHVRVRPLLTFEGRSPDATTTILAPPDALAPRRRFNAFIKEKDGFRAHYTDDGETTFTATKDGKGLEIEAVTRLDAPVYARVSAFTTIHAPFRASILLGPFEKPIDVDEGVESFAYLGSDLALHVARLEPEASGGTPYREVGRGKLARDEALAIELRRADGATGTCRLTFKDWTTQLSTEPSPSAGFGIPQNAIQLSRKANDTAIVLSLATASIGRGSATVGHTAGTYRNRIRVDTAMTSTTANAPWPAPAPPPPRHK
jgi:hypothetical protein